MSEYLSDKRTFTGDVYLNEHFGNIPSHKSPEENKDQNVCGGNLNASLLPCILLPACEQEGYVESSCIYIYI